MRRLLSRSSAVATLLATLSLVAGVTVALLSGVAGEQSSTFTSGDVSIGSTASTVCNLRAGGVAPSAALLPGDSSTGWTPSPGVDQPCTLKVTYTGANPAYLGIDLLIATKSGSVASGAPAGTTPTPLFDATANGLQLRVTDSANTVFVNGTTFTSQGAGAGSSTISSVPCASPYNISAYSCYQVNDLLVNPTAVTNGFSDTFSIDYALPLSSTSAYENSTAVVIMNVHAVQSNNNPLPAGPPSAVCQAGAQCSTGLQWN